MDRQAGEYAAERAVDIRAFERLIAVVKEHPFFKPAHGPYGLIVVRYDWSAR